MRQHRRVFLLAGASLVLLRAFGGRSATAAGAVTGTGTGTGTGTAVTIENFSAAGKSEGTVSLGKVVKSDAEWRDELSPMAFEVARRAGTEPPFLSAGYDGNHADGLYRCICCGTALFDSRTKFDSGTGWPSFYRALSHYNVNEGRDFSLGMLREAVSCRRCDAHLGHVFDDGPRPTGLRYCMNSVSLHFVARSA